MLLERLGFQDIEIGPEFLPDELQVKQQRLSKKFTSRILVSYLRDQIELYGDDLIFTSSENADSVIRKINLIHFCQNQNLFPEETDLTERETIIEWRSELIHNQLNFEDLDLMNMLVENFQFTNCIDLMQICPKVSSQEEAYNLKALLGLLTALMQENKDTPSFYDAPCLDHPRPSMNDVLIICEKLKELNQFEETNDLETINIIKYLLMKAQINYHNLS